MQRDPGELSIPLDAENALSGFPEFEETGELPQIPPQPTHLAAASVPVLTAARGTTWQDESEVVPLVGAGYADPEALETVSTPVAGREGVASSAKVSRAQRARRRIATGCSALCVALLMLALSVTALVYLRPIVEQPGSGQATGVEVHSTPELSPLAQVQSPQATATLQATATPGTGKQHDPKATPTQGRAPTPTAPTGGKPKSTATPIIVPTRVPTAGPTAVATGQPTPTNAPAPPTPTNPPPPPTATPIPPPPTATPTPGHGTLTFTDQSEQWSNPANMSGCPSGCTFATKPVSGSTHESTTRNTTGRTAQTQLSGSFDLSGQCSNGPGNPCNLSLTVGSICGDGICCPINVTLSGGEEANGVGCTVNTSSPTFIAAGALDGQRQRVGPRGTLTVSWSNSAFTGNGGRPYVSQADCDNGLSVVRSEASNWVASTWASASSGDVIARSYTESETDASCFPGVGTIASSFTASLNVSITKGLVYNPYGPINAAKAELTSAAPGAPWNWLYTSPACYPRTISVSGNDVTAACQDSGLAVWGWSGSDKDGLAQAVAGQTLQSAESICTGWAHVAGNCVATSDASNHMPPPSNWQAIVVSPKNPGDPFSASAGAVGVLSSGARLSGGAAAGLYVLLALLGLLLGAGGIGFKAHRRCTRKAVQ